MSNGSEDWEEEERFEFTVPELEKQNLNDDNQNQSADECPTDGRALRMEELVLDDDFGTEMRNSKWFDIWDQALSLISHKKGKEALKKIREQSEMFESKEKPFADCVFTVNEEEYECILLWQDSKVMLFADQNIDGFSVAKNCGWNCFAASDENMAAELLAKAIKEK